MRFTRVELTNWKNFPTANVALASRIFLVGPNATGKSNFLDAFRFLRDLVSEGGGLAKAMSLRDGISKVRSLHARQNTEVALQVTVQGDDGSGWRYEIAFSHQSLKKPIPVVVRERVERLRVGGSAELKLERPDAADRSDRERLTQTAIRQNLRFNFASSVTPVTERRFRFARLDLAELEILIFDRKPCSSLALAALPQLIRALDLLQRQEREDVMDQIAIQVGIFVLLVGPERFVAPLSRPMQPERAAQRLAPERELVALLLQHAAPLVLLLDQARFIFTRRRISRSARVTDL